MTVLPVRYSLEQQFVYVISDTDTEEGRGRTLNALSLQRYQSAALSLSGQWRFLNWHLCLLIIRWPRSRHRRNYQSPQQSASTITSLHNNLFLIKSAPATGGAGRIDLSVCPRAQNDRDLRSPELNGWHRAGRRGVPRRRYNFISVARYFFETSGLWCRWISLRRRVWHFVWKLLRQRSCGSEKRNRGKDTPIRHHLGTGGKYKKSSHIHWYRISWQSVIACDRNLEIDRHKDEIPKAQIQTKTS